MGGPSCRGVGLLIIQHTPPWLPLSAAMEGLLRTLKVDSSRQMGEDQNSKYHQKVSKAPIFSLRPRSGHLGARESSRRGSLSRTAEHCERVEGNPLSFSFFCPLKPQLPDNSMVTKLAVGVCKPCSSEGGKRSLIGEVLTAQKVETIPGALFLCVSGHLASKTGMVRKVRSRVE